NEVLVATIKDDLKAGNQPFMVVGTAGDVSTGVTDDLAGIASICKTFNLWFHIDGAYGMPAAVVPEFKEIFRGMDEADSIALDPHKWLYSPLEAGCTLVKDPQHLIDAYSAHPAYYNFDNDDESLPQNFYEYGLQNSRGFRALKVWTTLQQVGRNGYVRMISDDIALSRLFFKLAKEHPELEPITQNLSITTLRYVPVDLTLELANKEKYLNALNETLLNKLQQGGEVFLSNAIVDEKYCLRGCIVNFRTSAKDVEEIVEIIVKHGRLIDQQMKKN
ncbi:MAG TPA: pyridoxal-dependent decarboxylase, partial [Chryseolinea sp.]|nr:pyridoxal-dependent decarboxylase [Chryseolinea sp.]